MTTKKEKIADIINILESLYPDPPIPLKHKDPYTLLIAVILSGRSTDAMVNRVTPKLFTVADTPEKMVNLSVEEIRKIIQPCGLSPAKAKGIWETSKLLIENYNSKVPQSFSALEAFPHVGHKTASVVMSQAFNVPAMPVDTHIHRLAYRWGLSTGRNVAHTEHDLKKAFPKEKWNPLHLQMIYFGREHCPALRHNPYECPICSKYGRKSLFIEYDKKKSKAKA